MSRGGRETNNGKGGNGHSAAGRSPRRRPDGLAAEQHRQPPVSFASAASKKRRAAGTPRKRRPIKGFAAPPPLGKRGKQAKTRFLGWPAEEAIPPHRRAWTHTTALGEHRPESRCATTHRLHGGKAVGNNNYGWKSRDPLRACRFALRDAVSRGVLSFASSATHAQRFERFLRWARENHGVRKLEHITREHVIQFGQTLRGEVSARTHQNYISSINTVMRIASRGAWKAVSPRGEAGAPRRSEVRQNPVPSRAQIDRAIRGIGDPVIRACAQVMAELGLRAKEAGLLDPVRACREAERTGRITVARGTKGGRPRTVPVTKEAIRALEALRSALQGAQNAVSVFGGMKGYRSALNAHRGDLKANGVDRYHDLRASYAARRYEQLTGHQAPCMMEGRRTAPDDLDRRAREVIAQELGHGRIDVVAAYVGGR